jgi:hypothetical protein
MLQFSIPFLWHTYKHTNPQQNSESHDKFLIFCPLHSYIQIMLDMQVLSSFLFTTSNGHVLVYIPNVVHVLGANSFFMCIMLWLQFVLCNVVILHSLGI